MTKTCWVEEILKFKMAIRNLAALLIILLTVTVFTIESFVTTQNFISAVLLWSVYSTISHMLRIHVEAFVNGCHFFVPGHTTAFQPIQCPAVKPKINSSFPATENSDFNQKLLKLFRKSFKTEIDATEK